METGTEKTFSFDTSFGIPANDPAKQEFSLTLQQQEAIENIEKFLESDENYHLVSGDAGTGKTSCIKQWAKNTDLRVVFTAPTNKATKVLKNILTTKDYRPSCCTIFKLLGLQLMATGELKELVAPEDPIDLSKIDLIVLDEASMVSKILVKHIDRAVQDYNLKVLFMGDFNQLPPVNESHSEIWSLQMQKSELHEIIRFDNQILGLSAQLRERVQKPMMAWIKLINDNDGVEGVWRYDTNTFKKEIKRAARLGDFTNDWKAVKAIAWRNVTVNALNVLIRSQLFENWQEQLYLPGDRVILAAPANDIEGKPMAHTDDEGTIEQVIIDYHPLYPAHPCYNLTVMTDDNRRISLWTVHEKGWREWDLTLKQMAAEARENPKRWKLYWDFKDAFHQIKHSYAITAHRSQGSTYDHAYVVWNDILINRNRQEAYRCLYVACTRAKTKLILGSV